MIVVILGLRFFTNTHDDCSWRKSSSWCFEHDISNVSDWSNWCIHTYPQNKGQKRFRVYDKISCADMSFHILKSSSWIRSKHILRISKNPGQILAKKTWVPQLLVCFMVMGRSRMDLWETHRSNSAVVFFCVAIQQVSLSAGSFLWDTQGIPGDSAVGGCTVVVDPMPSTEVVV